MVRTTLALAGFTMTRTASFMMPIFITHHFAGNAKGTQSEYEQERMPVLHLFKPSHHGNHMIPRDEQQQGGNDPPSYKSTDTT